MPWFKPRHFLCLPGISTRETAREKMKLHLYRSDAPISTELSHSLLLKVLPGHRAEELRLTPQGKPYFESGPQFSISHTGSRKNAKAGTWLWGCAAAENDEEGPVGLDIQEKREAKYFEIAERFFTSAEAEYLKGFLDAGGEEGDDAGLCKAFFRIWCRKEAYVKYTGRGFSETGFDTFSVLDENGEPAEKLSLCGEEVAFTECSVGDGYICVVCRKETENDKICILVGE